MENNTSAWYLAQIQALSTCLTKQTHNCDYCSFEVKLVVVVMLKDTKCTSRWLKWVDWKLYDECRIKKIPQLPWGNPGFQTTSWHYECLKVAFFSPIPISVINLKNHQKLFFKSKYFKYYLLVLSWFFLHLCLKGSYFRGPIY